MTQAYFSSGYGFALLLMFILMYILQFATLKDVQIKEKNQKYDLIHIKMYLSGIFQTLLIIMMLLMPIILFLINLNWLTAFLCILLTYSMITVTLIQMKKLEKNLSIINEKRNETNKNLYLNTLIIKKYFRISAIIFVAGLIFLITLNVQGLFLIEKMGDTYGYDLQVFGLIILIIYALGKFANGTVEKVISLVMLENDQLNAIKDLEIDQEKVKNCKVSTDVKKEKEKEKKKKK